MGIPPPLAELRGGVGLSAAIFFAPPAHTPAPQKRISATIPNASPPHRPRLRGLCRAGATSLRSNNP
ncbi:MAG: hypothetical protein LBQ31_09095 [Bacteroidales bacterium]|nr:hypothetical protein [Bacteroidales bacterium]